MASEDISIGIQATGADTTAEDVNKVTDAIKNLNDAPTDNVSAFATSIDDIKNAATGVNEPLTTAATGIKSLGGAYDETATKSKSLGDTFTDLGTKSGTATTNFKTFATSMVGAAGSIAGISAGILGIVESYTQMERAQTSADRASNRYQQGLILLQTDQQKVNDLVAKGAQGTPEYAKAVETLALQQDKNRTNLDFMNEAQMRASESAASFYTQVIPNAINIIGNIATAIVTVPKAIDTMRGAFSTFGGSLSGVKSAISDFVSGITGVSPAAEGASTSVKALSVAMAAIPFAVGAAAATAFIVGIQQIYAHTADVHSFFTSLGTDVDTVVPHTKQGFVEMGNAVTQTAEFFKIGLDRMSNELKLTNINQDITKEKMSELLTQVKETGSTTIAKFDEETKAIVASYAAQGKSIDQAIADYKKNEDATAQAVADLKHYQEASKATGESLEKDLTAKINGLTAALTGVVPGLESFGKTGTTIRTVFTELGTEMDTFGAIVNKSTADYVKFGTDVGASLEKLKPAFKDLGTDANQILNQALKDAQAAMSGDSQAATRLTADLKLVNQVVHDNSDAVKQAQGAEILHRDILIEIASRYIGYSAAVKLTNKDLENINKTTDDGTQAVLDLVNQINALNGAQQNTARFLNEQAKGYDDVIKKQLEEKDAVAAVIGGLQAQFDIMKSGQPQIDAFNKGQRDQYQLFLNQVIAIDNTLGKQREYFSEIQNGSGVLKIQDDEMVALNEAYIKAGEQLIKQNTALSNSQDLWTRYNTDVLAGKSAVADFYIKLQDSQVIQDTQLAGLKAQADLFGGLPAYIAPTIDNYEQFDAANIKAGKAIDDFNLKAKKDWSDLTSAGDTFFSALIKSFGETGKTASDDFSKAFTDLPAEVQRILTPQDRQSLAVQAAFAHAGDAAGQAFAIKTQAAIDEGLTPEQAIKQGEQSAAGIIQGFVQQHPQFAAQANEFFSTLSTGSATQIKAALDQMSKMPGPLGEAARNAQTALKPTFEKLAPDAQTAVQSTMQALDQLGLKVNTVSGQVTTASGQVVGSINAMTGGFTALQTPVSLSADALRQLGLNLNTASGQITTAGGQIVGSINTTTGAFQAMPAAVDPATASINSFSSSWASLVQQSNAVTSGTTLTSRFANTQINTANVGGGLKIPVPDATGFNTAMDAATAKINTLQTAMTTGIGTLKIAAPDLTAFEAALGKIQTDANNAFNAVVNLATTIFPGIGKAMTSAMTTIQPAFSKIQTDANNAFNAVVNAANITIPKVAAAFTTMAGGTAPALTKIQTDSSNAFNAVVNLAKTIIPTASKAFDTLASDTATSLTKIQRDSTNAFQAVVNAAKISIPTAASAWSSLADAIQAPLNKIVRDSTNAFQAVVNAARIAMQQIPTTFGAGAGTGAAPAATAGQGFVFAQHGFVGVVDKPTSFVVGEAGPEYVSVIPGGTAGTIGDTMAVGLTNMVANISRTIEAMGFFLTASNRTTLSFSNSSLAADKNTKSLNDVTTSANNNLIATNTNTTATDNSTTALNATTTAADNTTEALFPVPPAAASTITGLNGTSNAANNATGSLGNMANALNQVPAQFADLMARMQAGVQASAFAGLAQYGNFSGGAGGGAATGGGGGGGAAYYGPAAFAGLAQYGNFSYGSGTGQMPAGGGGGIQGAPYGVGPFGGLAQYGNFSAGSGSGQAPSGGSQAIQGAPYGVGPFGGLAQYGQFSAGQAQGGVKGPQGGASSPQQQQPKAAASGFEGIVSSATRFIAGESGPEHVRVTPLKDIGSSSNDVNSILAMIAELVRQLTNQSLNINLSSYLDGYQVYKNQQKYTQGRTGNYLG
jgi:hypothetical protein